MTQTNPYRRGETLYRAFFPRNAEGIVIAAGSVEQADDDCFVVRSTGREESQLQSAPAGWHRTREEALQHLARGLDITTNRVEADARRLRAKMQHVNRLLADLTGDA